MGYFKNLWNAITGKTDEVQADAVNAAVESTTSKFNEEYETIQKEHKKELDAVQKEAFQEGIEYGHDALIADRKVQEKSELRKQMAIHDNEEKREKQSWRRAESFEESLKEVLEITKKRQEEDPLHRDKYLNENLDKQFSEIQKRIQKNITEGRKEDSFYLNMGYNYGAHMSPLEHFMGYAFNDIDITPSKKSSSTKAAFEPKNLAIDIAAIIFLGEHSTPIKEFPLLQAKGIEGKPNLEKELAYP